MSVKGQIKLHTTSVLYDSSDHSKQSAVKKEPISLIYFLPDKEGTHIDVNSFRPDPADYLTPEKTYNAVLQFDDILIPCGKEVKNTFDNTEKQKWSSIKVLRRVEIKELGVKFANIR